MDKNSNIYTFLFVGVIVIGIASILAFTSQTLKPMQKENVKNEKMQNILSTIGINVSREEAEGLYSKYIKEELALKIDGSVNESLNPFSEINLAKELKKDYKNQHFPLYVAEVESEKYYIIELRGVGLWDAIWGYIALEEDKNTIKGAVFDHKGETAGLGAEITQQWFQNRFLGEKVFDPQGNLVGINVSKTNNDPKDLDKDDHEVDAISGATITGDGVTDMIKERLTHYLPYLKQEKSIVALYN